MILADMKKMIIVQYLSQSLLGTTFFLNVHDLLQREASASLTVDVAEQGAIKSESFHTLIIDELLDAMVLQQCYRHLEPI